MKKKEMFDSVDAFFNNTQVAKMKYEKFFDKNNINEVSNISIIDYDMIQININDKSKDGYCINIMRDELETHNPKYTVLKIENDIEKGRKDLFSVDSKELGDFKSVEINMVAAIIYEANKDVVNKLEALRHIKVEQPKDINQKYKR